MSRAADSAFACAGFQRCARLHRRDLLQVGGLYGLGLFLPDLFRAQALAKSSGTFGRAKSVIMLYLHGGHAQPETWDSTPDRSTPARGALTSIATSSPGTRHGY